MALIIAGHQRSGTTLLKNLFNSHPEAAITGEFGNFMLLGASYREYRRFILRRWWQKRNAAILDSHPLKGINMLSNLVFVTRYLARIRSNTRECVDAYTIEAALKDLFPQAKVVGDKYPDHVFRLQEIVGVGPLRCVFIYRDPRDVASSALKRARIELRNSWPDELRDARKIAERWLYAVKLIERYQDRIFMIRYEDLVTDPEPILSGLGDWLGIDAQQFRHKMIHRGSVGKHKQGLSDQEITDIVSIAGPVMQRLGYRI